MNLLIITNLFPNAAEPNRSTFNFQQFSALSKLCALKVVAPLPFLQYSKQQVPSFEKIGGIDVFHPRYLVVPKIGRCTYAATFFIGVWHTLKVICLSFKYEAILVAWAYPDAVGTAFAAKLLGKKYFVKVHGSDINLAHEHLGRVAMIRWALLRAEKVIAVSQPLKKKIVAMGIPSEKVVVITNGVDKERFYPQEKAHCRKILGLLPDKKYILFVGNLVEVKGVEFLIRALKDVHDTYLLLVGDGYLRGTLEALATELGINDRVFFRGRQAHDDIPIWFNAVDVFCLPSLNEGCPNVVFEALACGVKVVASNVGGVPDIIDTSEKGWLARPKDSVDLARCLNVALHTPALAGRVQTITWDESARQILQVLTAGN